MTVLFPPPPRHQTQLSFSTAESQRPHLQLLFDEARGLRQTNQTRTRVKGQGLRVKEVKTEQLNTDEMIRLIGS